MSADVEISVIIPIFNAERYLGKCLDSIINQSFKNLRDENFILSTTIKKYESYNTFKFNKYLNDILNRNK
ncbi:MULTISPECIES: glycosyltransferase [Methanobrevibacter]|jgi:glycosyltransferase involved in cell wall biosynthesis|uniref:glycosyltransferase n=1 Tax=Methanobrevibacter TaxID=2172 RepID=UPI0011C84081|nr:glycosyltransferase [Methanobrevibacter smithii]